jgi:lambda family phage minor tail protein L
MTLRADVQKNWHDGLVEMFDFDLSSVTGDANDVFYFTNQLKPDNAKIVWQGRTYDPLPILSTGYEKTTAGQIPQPSLTVANVLGTLTQAVNSYGDMVGAKVTRRRTLGKYLDGEPAADPTQEFPIDVYYIEQKTSENAIAITWTLVSTLDLEGLQLPKRIITQNHCQWRYRSSECGYTGGPVADELDRLTADPAADVCGKRLKSCQLRFGNQSLPYGGFPGANISR